LWHYQKIEGGTIDLVYTSLAVLAEALADILEMDR
jgi:hypothetical protein